jgi:hypothetical protein
VETAEQRSKTPTALIATHKHELARRKKLLYRRLLQRLAFPWVLGQTQTPLLGLQEQHVSNEFKESHVNIAFLKHRRSTQEDVQALDRGPRRTRECKSHNPWLPNPDVVKQASTLCLIE